MVRRARRKGSNDACSQGQDEGLVLPYRCEGTHRNIAALWATGTSRPVPGSSALDGRGHSSRATRDRKRDEWPEGWPAVGVTREEGGAGEAIRQHSEKFVDLYKPGSKPSEKREKRRVLKTDLLPYFGDMTIDELKQTDVDAFATAELERVKVKTVNNGLAVLNVDQVRHSEKSRLRFKLAGMAGGLKAVATRTWRVLAAADDGSRAAILLASEAGLRAGEIRGLQWGDIKESQLTVRRGVDKLTNEVIAPKHNKAGRFPCHRG